MSWVSAFLSVIAIIGIIMVGGFVIFFLGDIVLSVLDPNYVRFGKGKKDKDSKEQFASRFNEDVTIKEIDAKQTKEIEYNPLHTEEKRGAVIEQGIEGNFFDNDKTSKKEAAFSEEVQDLDDLRAEEEQFRVNMLKAIEERKAKKDESQAKDIDFDKFFFDDDDIDVFGNNDESFGEIEGQEEIESLFTEKYDDIESITEDEIREIFKSGTEEVVEVEEGQALEVDGEEVSEGEVVESEISEDKVLEDKNEEVQEDNIQTENIDSQSDDDANKEEIQELRKKFQEEISKLELENLEIKKEKDRLEKETTSAKEKIAKLVEEKEIISKDLEEECVGKEKSKAALTIEEYESQLVKLKERLSENEKELRKIKKEFIPLRRVHKTLERDEKKLRRREALVARQKVELYGVNNIVDIDQEKAKKLTEDLDLLEGLKLSVKHCEEVVAANKERYPILEKTYTILFEGSKTMKEDIAEIEEKIEKLKTDEE